jgi:pimeloyl-ACP methyl ester carboxylesterase
MTLYHPEGVARSYVDLMTRWRLSQHHSTTNGVVVWDRLGSGPPVVLLHGTPFSSYVWRDVASALARTHSVFVWDMLGYGNSEKRPDQDVSLATQAAVFAELLQAWELDRPAVVAHDFGGAVALRALLLHDSVYDRLVLVDAVAHSPWGTGLFQLVREHPDVLGRLPSALHEALVRAYISGASHRGLPESTLAAYVSPWLGAEGQAALYRQMAQGDERFTDEMADRYADIDMPVMVCWGTEDTWLLPSKGEQLAAAIPAAELRWLHGAGHLVQEDAPAQLTAAVVDFLR